MKSRDSVPPAGNGTGRSSARLVAAIGRDIRAGAVGAGDFLPPVRTLAQHHGMAVATVCKGLRQLAREGVVVAVPRRGYRVLAHADVAASGESLACVISEENITAGWEAFYVAIETAIRRAAGRYGWPTTWFTVELGNERALRGRLQALGAWGMVLNSINPEVLAVARRGGIPVVMVDAWKHDLPFDVVVQDDFCGAELATRHLLERGHRTFGWFGPIGESHHSRARFGGAVTTLATAGLSLARSVEVSPRSSDLAARASLFLAQPHRPTAILALWPSTAVALATAARKARLAAGKDFEMVGWCAEEIYEGTFIPSLGGMRLAATVVWSAAAMAAAAIQRLIERRSDPARPSLRLNIATRLRFPGAI